MINQNIFFIPIKMKVEDFCRIWPLAMSQGWTLIPASSNPILPTSPTVYYAIQTHNMSTSNLTGQFSTVNLGGIIINIPSDLENLNA